MTYTKKEAMNDYNIMIEMIFGKDTTSHLDPNEPAMMAFVEKDKQNKRDNMLLWKDNGGNVILEAMAKEVRGKILRVIGMNRSTEANRIDSLYLLDEIKRTIEFLVKVEKIINKG